MTESEDVPYDGKWGDMERRAGRRDVRVSRGHGPYGGSNSQGAQKRNGKGSEEDANRYKKKGSEEDATRYTSRITQERQVDDTGVTGRE